jgi:lysozyme
MKWLAPTALTLLAATAVWLFWPRRAEAAQVQSVDGFAFDMLPAAPGYSSEELPAFEPLYEPYEPPSLIDTVMNTVTDFVSPTPASDMRASDELRRILKASEALRLQPYNLGDGGWTVGYGHFEKRREDLPVLNSQADAEALFDKDLEERAEQWVRAYVTVPLLQHQYDALTHIAYNMSPKSFRLFANEVNAGRGIAEIAERSIAWVKPEHTRGIRNRRNREIELFEEGVYA